MNIFLVNTGSTSKRFAFYKDDSKLFSAYLEKKSGKFLAHIFYKEKNGEIEISESDFHDPYKNLTDFLIANKFLTSKSEIDIFGVRIVAPGRFFQEHKEIDNIYLDNLKKAAKAAPLHIIPVIKEIETIERFFGKAKLIGISDSEFHKDLPEISKNYAIDKSDAKEFDLYRFGYHGISLGSIVRKIEDKFGGMSTNCVICHLGGGASITALKTGKSIDTSMGFSPLEGLVMATRVGDIDPGILIEIGKKLNLDYDQLEDYLNHKSGLLGLSGLSSDPRDLLEEMENGNKDTKLALEIYCYRIKKYIGAYFAALGGLDMIIFSGAIGERSGKIREMVCSDLENLGVILDKNKNLSAYEEDTNLESLDSKVKIMTVGSEELEEMARLVCSKV